MKKLSRLTITLVEKLIKKKLIDGDDKYYYVNKILNEFNTKLIPNILPYEDKNIAWLFNQIGILAETILKVSKEKFINKISDLVSFNPKVIREQFEDLSKKDTKKAFAEFYKLSTCFYYIKKDRTQKNIEWKIKTRYGNIQLTINKSKPEKSIYDIVNSISNPNSDYPKCVLCKENMGLEISSNAISKQNLRFVNTTLNNKRFFMHYSPYEYYKEHLIVNNFQHSQMQINYDTYKELIDFIDKYNFYFIGSNADLPIVGGSILNHKHFQGGFKDLPIFKAKSFYKKFIQNSQIELLEWPLATIKVSNFNKEKLYESIKYIHDAWFGYSNKKLMIYNSKKDRHNTITPIAEYRNNKYIVYLILRNNSISKKYPSGNFHIKPNKWNIKKENIGLIEAGGKAILPARLEKEMQHIEAAIKTNKKKLNKDILHHQDWYSSIYKDLTNSKNIKKLLLQKVGETFISGLEDTNVFKDKNDLINFVETI